MGNLLNTLGVYVPDLTFLDDAETLIIAVVAAVVGIIGLKFAIPAGQFVYRWAVRAFTR